MKATGLFLHTVQNTALSMKKIFLLFPSSVSFDATNIEDENKLKQYLDNYFRALEGNDWKFFASLGVLYSRDFYRFTLISHTKEHFTFVGPM